MEELAPIYNLHKTSAMIAGILHDIAKEFTPEELINMARENNIVVRTEYDKIPLFLHGPVGACYIAQKFGEPQQVLCGGSGYMSRRRGVDSPDNQLCSGREPGTGARTSPIRNPIV